MAAEALEATESARIFWERGEIEVALSTLDNAYALLLEIPDGDPYLDQEKDNLRHLISRRVVEIYRSRLTSAVDLASSIPIELNEHVEREIRSFQNGERDFFIESYRRSGMYRPTCMPGPSVAIGTGRPNRPCSSKWFPLGKSTVTKCWFW